VNKLCTSYEGTSDSVSGKLQVVGADIELPQIDLLLQHGSELGLDDVSICMMRQPLVEGRSIGDKDYKWVLGISVSSCPYHQHDETTEGLFLRSGKIQN
jgi:hypothetical protein